MRVINGIIRQLTTNVFFVNVRVSFFVPRQKNLLADIDSVLAAVESVEASLKLTNCDGETVEVDINQLVPDIAFKEFATFVVYNDLEGDVDSAL